jgi:hypothetical protein
VHEDFKELPNNTKLCVIKPDTEATGRTSEVALERTFKLAEERNSEIARVIIYGFVSKPGLEYVEKFLKPYGPQISVFAIENLTALCFNNYDMPMYGVDESFYSEYKKIRKVGGSVSRQTFERLLPEFVIGSDEPGDWSARQERVFDGESYEDGGIPNHLKNTMSLIRRLSELLDKVPELGNFRGRYKEMIAKELSQLEALTMQR